MANPTKVLDETRFEARARVGDVIALGLVVIIGAGLLFNMYTLGYSASEVSRHGGNVFARDKQFVIVLIEAVLVASGFSWIVYRIFSGGARRVGG